MMVREITFEEAAQASAAKNVARLCGKAMSLFNEQLALLHGSTDDEEDVGFLVMSIEAGSLLTRIDDFTREVAGWCRCSDGERRFIEWGNYYWPGTYWDPPESDMRFNWFDDIPYIWQNR